MKFDGTLIVVKDMDVSKEFYTEVMGMKIVADYGANVSFEGGLSLQTEESWIKFTGQPSDSFRYGGNDMELYFTHNDLESFLRRISSMNMEVLQNITEMPWSQRVIRFYDPDKHVIEIGESMDFVVERLLKEGLTHDEVSKRSLMPIEYVKMISDKVQ